MLVIGRHFELPNDAPVMVSRILRGGWVGVDIFFVLSGFLVSSLLFREYISTKKINISRFLVRRAFKIYPSFYLFMSFTLIMCKFFNRVPTSNAIVGELTFLQNYIGSIWNHTWSLAVEEHFYILLAAVFGLWVLLRKNDPFTSIPALFVLIAITCLTFRVSNLFFATPFSYEAYVYRSHIRADSLFAGVLIAYLWYFRSLESLLSSVKSWQLLMLGCALLSPAYMFELESNKWVSVYGFILFYCGSAALLLGAMRLKSSTSKLINMLAMLGGASYSIYLWHSMVMTWGYKVIKNATGVDNFYLYTVIAVFGSIGLGFVLYRISESPVVKLRDRLFPSLSK